MRIAARILLCAIAALSTVPAWAGTPLPDAPHVVVTGRGKVTTVPDQVRVSAQFEARDPQTLPAKRQVDEAVNRYLRALGRFDIDREDVDAGSLHSYEQMGFHEGRQVSNGIVASRGVEVTLKDVAQLNQLIDAGLEAGAKAITPSQWKSSREDALNLEAKALASRDARKQAEQVAAGFDAKVGLVYSIDSLQMGSSLRFDPFSPPAPPAPAADVGASVGVYAKPTLDYTQTVQAVFELKR